MKIVSFILLLVLPAVLVFPCQAAASSDTVAPRVLHELVGHGVIGQNLELRVRLSDQSEIFEPKVYFRRVGELEYNTIDLVRGPKDEWIGVVPATFVTRDIEYFLEAYDIMGNGPSRHGGPDRPHLVRISTRIEPSAGQPRQVTDVPSQPANAVRPAPPEPAPMSASASVPVTKTWWFWTAIGVLAIGAAAGAAVGVLYGTGVLGGRPGTPTDRITVRIAGPDPREGL